MNRTILFRTIAKMDIMCDGEVKPWAETCRTYRDKSAKRLYTVFDGNVQ